MVVYFEFDYPEALGGPVGVFSKEGHSSILQHYPKMPIYQPGTRHPLPASLPEDASLPNASVSPAAISDFPQSVALSSPSSSLHAPSRFLPPISPLSLHYSKVNCGAYLWYLPLSESKVEDEGVKQLGVQAALCEIQRYRRECVLNGRP